MNILVTGGTGFIGSALTNSLRQGGHAVVILSRSVRQSEEGCRYVNSLSELGGDIKIDGVINLAGASLAGKRWSSRYKQEIFSSRLDTTRALVAWLSERDRKPEIMISASAIGYYGQHGDEVLAEDGAVVPGFAQDLCQQWENEALKAAQLGIRVCLARLGVVLDRDGGAFVEMARPFRFGVANWMGSGRQWLSWVHRADVIAALLFLLEHPVLSGPFNITAPEPVTSRGFCDAMKRHKRTLLTAPVPAAAMRLLVGEMADELLLSGQRVVPEALLSAGFEFRFSDLDAALAEIL